MARHPNEVWLAAEESRKIGKPYAAKDLGDIVERLALVKGNLETINVNKLIEDTDEEGLSTQR
jgi:hypothetical protein